MKIDEAVRLMQDGAECVCAFNSTRYNLIDGSLHWLDPINDVWILAPIQIPIVIAEWTQFKEPNTIKDVIKDTILSREQIQKINKCPLQDIDYKILEFYWDKLKSNIIENLEEAKLI